MPHAVAVHIIVPVKWVPDAQLERRFTEQRRIDRSEGVLGELDEYPLEAALQIKEAAEAEVRVSALTIGPDGASTAAKKALQIGADDAFHLSDEALTGGDVSATSAALKAAVEQILAGSEFDGDAATLVLTGMSSEDGESGAVPAQLAERLGAHLITQVTELSLEGGRLTATRVSTGSGHAEQQKLAAPLPAVVSVTDQANDPRYPNFKAIMAAKKKPLTTWQLSDVALEPAAAEAKLQVLSAEARPPRTAGEIITDEGDAGVKIVEFLAKERVL